jgi:hypothetical protein
MLGLRAGRRQAILTFSGEMKVRGEIVFFEGSDNLLWQMFEKGCPLETKRKTLGCSVHFDDPSLVYIWQQAANVCQLPIASYIAAYLAQHMYSMYK